MPPKPAGDPREEIAKDLAIRDLDQQTVLHRGYRIAAYSGGYLILDLREIEFTDEGADKKRKKTWGKYVYLRGRYRQGSWQGKTDWTDIQLMFSVVEQDGKHLHMPLSLNNYKQPTKEQLQLWVKELPAEDGKSF